ncbi:MAG: PD40 domain-containing protein [Candidatus Marinimicrobia bacterium]|nr:PD40 domain-containing protein [Candidatus Neomarinimicrobiota bacterium]MBC8346989.1 PD40 domain-containing protein [Candidatus Neomarinimicrobiota bacterium]
MKRFILNFIGFIILVGLNACTDIYDPLVDTECEKRENIGVPHLPYPSYPSPYQDPSWSSDGKSIVFYRMKVTRISGAGSFFIDYDSTGIWMINADGSDMRLILKGSGYRSPDLSPDGKWLAFKFGGQIYNAPFVNGQIDTTGFVQLTSVGSNHYPAWSHDGEWIAYARSVCEGTRTCGVWIINSNGERNRFIADYGMYPTWHPFKKEILYNRRVVTEGGKVLGDSLWVFNVESNENMRFFFLTDENYDNRHMTYSLDGEKIAFSSQPEECPIQIWTINSDGTNLKQLTHEGASSEPSWSPDGRIVYVHYVSGKLDVNSGTLWVMDGDGGNQRQLTFNHGLILDP